MLFGESEEKTKSMAETYSMKEACALTGLSYTTLKYYCNKGLIPNVKRDEQNNRLFDDRDIRWVKDLICLKKCRLSIAEMKRYIDLCYQGMETMPERLKLLETKRDDLLGEIEEIRNILQFIDHKIDFFDQVRTGKRPYYSNLIELPEGENDETQTWEEADCLLKND